MSIPTTDSLPGKLGQGAALVRPLVKWLHVYAIFKVAEQPLPVGRRRAHCAGRSRGAPCPCRRPVSSAGFVTCLRATARLLQGLSAGTSMPYD